ncbi:helix-turn-helix domain-containing protein [Kitasatospora sp. NPDC089509]|uniref:helix-turn-helix domain-containing protein n=1 Tax=Kitasatospora sp. NPDC089509 TaxID=3364079 RepID=UPI0038263AF8
MSETPFGRRLRALRRQQALSQSELGGREISASYISLLESGRRLPTEEAVVKLAARLGISAEELVGDTGAAVPRPASTQPLESELLLNRARLALATGRPEAAAELFAQLVTGSEAAPGRRADAQRGRARALELAGRLVEAAALYQSWLDAFAELGDDPVLRLETVSSLARCLREVGELRLGARQAEQALAAARELELGATPVGLDLAGLVAEFRWDLGQEEALEELVAEFGGDWGAELSRTAAALAYSEAAEAAGQAGRLPQAVALAGRAVQVCDRGDALCPTARLRLSAPMVTADQAGSSIDALAPYVEELLAWGTPADAAAARTAQARVLLADGQPEAARETALAALERVGPAWQRTRARALLVLADAEWRLGDRGSASGHFEEAAELLTLVGAERQGAAAYLELAALLEADGDVRRALACYRRASEVAGLLPAGAAHDERPARS